MLLEDIRRSRRVGSGARRAARGSAGVLTRFAGQLESESQESAGYGVDRACMRLLGEPSSSREREDAANIEAEVRLGRRSRAGD